MSGLSPQSPPSPPAPDAPALTVPKPLLYCFGQVICRIFTTLWFDLKVTGVEHVPRRGGAIIASNHQSNLDPVLIGVRNQRPLSYLAKSSLFEKPAFSWLIRNLNAVPVRQGEGDIGAVKETIRRLQEGHLLNIFPEGTRSRDGEIAPILPGIGLIAKRADVPVIPAVIDGSFDAMRRGSKKIYSVPIRVVFGPPLEIEGLKAGQIVAKIDTTLRTMMNELRASDPLLQEARRQRHAE